jgi:hypothetical protein
VALREFFPAALDAFEELAVPEALELLGVAPDPASAAALSRAQIRRALARARRRNPDQRAAQVQAALRAPSLANPRWSPPPTRPPSGHKWRSSPP